MKAIVISKDRMSLVLPKEISESDILSDNEKMTLAAIMNYYACLDKVKQQKYVFLSNKTLRESVGIRQQHLLEAIQGLIEYGLIKREVGDASHRLASKYYVQWGNLKKPIKKLESDDIFSSFYAESEPLKTPMGTTDIDIDIDKDIDKDIEIEKDIEEEIETEIDTNIDTKIEEKKDILLNKIDNILMPSSSHERKKKAIHIESLSLLNQKTLWYKQHIRMWCDKYAYDQVVKQTELFISNDIENSQLSPDEQGQLKKRVYDILKEHRCDSPCVHVQARA